MDGINVLDLIKVLGPAAFAGGVAVLTAFYASRARMKELGANFENQLRAERQRDEAKLRIQRLAPLQVAAMDLSSRISEIMEKRKNPEELEFLKNTFRGIKDRNRDDREGFVAWCNGGMGHYAMSTLYVTTLYLAHAARIRPELPAIQLSHTRDQALLDRISAVRKSLGGQYGVWEPVQDSIGSYIVKPDGTLMNFREFSNSIIDKSEYLWFLRLIDFYRDIHMKPDPELHAMSDSLSALAEFLKEVSKPRVDSARVPVDQ